MEEFEYIEKAKKDPKQFRFLYEKYYKQIFLFINRRTDDENTSADITQQVFLKAMQHLGNYEYRGIPFSAWLYRIASNEVMQHFRDQSKERVVCLDASDLSDLIDEKDSGLDYERRESVFKAIKKLHAAEIELIEMRFFEKRSFKEIADIKGITENNAKTKTYRVIEKIKSLITVKV